MAATWIEVGIVALLVIVAVIAMLRYRQHGKIGIHGPGGLGIDVEGSNEGRPAASGVTVEDAIVRSDGIAATHTDGGDVAVRRVDVQGGINASSGRSPDPKA